ncbi:glycoside hydrolase domain-containing protein [Pelotalea chapellei]|uniref:DUF4091 domain-containing protein n=1 Tax=Pelotalea chapellei TaxID=44671 RepID=A0ABS5U5F9_9BACT|nr:glycoside hydrolase domain-containing protein [Pelotalea chapellei]MBT1070887.1 DUF4091 domain-containing protein [Pelotalea chapellei]
MLIGRYSSEHKIMVWGSGLLLCLVLYVGFSSLNQHRAAHQEVVLPANIQPLPGSHLTAVWANDGGDKVTRDELRVSRGIKVENLNWNGKSAKQFGAQNEVVSLNLVLESALTDAREINVSFDVLRGSDNSRITSRKVAKDEVFNYVGRNIELFYVRYLQIKGLSRLSYDPTYDERHVPKRFQLPYNLPKGTSKGAFADRPDANKFYPDIAVPIEAVNSFSIKKGNNQSIWIDIYIPKRATPGIYKGTIQISESDKNTIGVPVELEVLPFALPDKPSAKTMMYISEPNINYRYTGVRWDDSGGATPEKRAVMQKVWNMHHLAAHRHKVSLVNDGLDPLNKKHWKMQRWIPVFSGDLFTKKFGYDGPGVGEPSDIYSIGTYGAWRSKRWSPDSEADMRTNTDKWAEWFEVHFPNTEHFLYLLDEPQAKDFHKVEGWASWIKNNPGPGKNLKTLVTSNVMKIAASMPSTDIGFVGWGDEAKWRPFIDTFGKAGKTYWGYNGTRPMNGSFAIEDEGVALRVNAWSQFKHKAQRWFYWESTQYKNSSTSSFETNVFAQAQTFGRKDEKLHPKYGETGSGYNNGDGVLFYPGTDSHFVSDSYGLSGPIVSLRLKQWRRGLQDVDYLTMAEKVDPSAVKAIVQRMIPKTMWEVGVTDPKDPSYVHADISWPINPEAWEQARKELAKIIMMGKK